MSFKQLSKPGHLGHHLAMLPQGEGILAILATLQKTSPFYQSRRHQPTPSNLRANLRYLALPPCARKTTRLQD